MSPLLAQSGHAELQCACPLLGVKRTCSHVCPKRIWCPKRRLIYRTRGVSEFSALKRNEKPQCVLGDQDTPGLPSSGAHATLHSRCTLSRLRSNSATS